MRPEQPIQENLADIKEPSKQTEGGLEIAKTPESKTVVDLANEFHEAIQNDSPITYGKVEDFREALGKMKFNIDGELMTIEEARKIPNLKENLKIMKEIEAGNFNNIYKLTYLTDRIAESLSRSQNDLRLNRLTSLSDLSAASLSHHQGNLYLNSLNSISNKAAKFLSHHRGNVYANDEITQQINKFKVRK
ncbi:MAG: hypothetical protein WC663_01650 [Patescibacteria group bacterium]|jgi:hypothetical protein